MAFPAISIEIPLWISEVLPLPDQTFPAPEDRMRLVIELARRNVSFETGGPFAAGVFDMRSGLLLAPGVNLVLSTGLSIAHAEIVALSLAQKALGNFDLGAGGRQLELVTSTEPCAMCFGALPWAGIRRLVCGARSEDAQRVGFDEGDKPSAWIASLQKRNISVLRDVLRQDAAHVLQTYAASGGIIYNSAPP